jgi:hypothetical protein
MIYLLFYLLPKLRLINILEEKVKNLEEEKVKLLAERNYAISDLNNKVARIRGFGDGSEVT